MKKPKVYILGRRGNRLPFSYPEYRVIFSRHFEFIDEPETADYIVAGCDLDLFERRSELDRLAQKRAELAILVFSEEPFWDSTRSGGGFNPVEAHEFKRFFRKRRLSYHVINHSTSRIYDFDNFPYFITTDQTFFSRYAAKFQRNLQHSAVELQRTWSSAPVRYAFFAARRVGTAFDVNYNDKLIGLSRFRSLVAEGLDVEGVVREGQGWGSSSVRRQDLPDWHLEKIKRLDRQSYIVSALENTHLDNYVSEKLFDAFAVLGIPVYFAHPGHSVFRLVEGKSFINLSGLSVAQAIHALLDFRVDKEFVEIYRASQARLAELFSKPELYSSERQRLVHETVAAFRSLGRG